MADTSAETTEAAPDWLLIAEFMMTDLSQNKRSLKTQIVEATQALNIPPARLKQICQVTIQALDRLERRMKLSGRHPAIHIRIWSSKVKAGSNSWGFFIVQKSGRLSPRQPASAADLVDLYLYQEHGPHLEGC